MRAATIAATNSGRARSEDIVLATIRDNPNATQELIAATTGLSRTTVQRAMKSLQGDGTIERVGSRKSGWWRVVK